MKFLHNIYFIFNIILSIGLCKPLLAQTWSDGFESYTTGTFPSNWTPDGNATANATNYVTTTTSFSGTKSLQLYGTVGGCWGALAYRSLTISPPFEIELAIRNGNETLSGCHPYRANFGLRKGTSWANPSRQFILFNGEGEILGATNNLLQTYTTLEWYTVRIRYESPSSSEVRISYWINGIYKGVETLAAQSEEGQMTNFEITVQEGTAWFDNVILTSAITTNIS
ncbi:MAG TPA: hypothetical protein VI583_01460 [Cyclobacteriaceae bacterium]|nr:hypothetical protein [Cyclobacteriaceae bacterium]